MNQPGFDFTERRYLSLVKNLDRLMAVLADGHWHKSRDLVQQLHTTDRKLRQLAEFSRGQVVSGQRGYCLTRFASNDEIDHAERWLLSQARKMTDRAREIRIARNRGVAA